jgi:hypothetical protein
MERTSPGTVHIPQFVGLAVIPPQCETRAVIASSLIPTRKYRFYRMFFTPDLSFSRDAPKVCEEKENEGHDRG